MRSKTIFGALLVSVALCSQGFGLELLDRMRGADCGGCGECNACAKVACCEKACPKACCPEPACCEKANCGTCKKCRATPVRDLFAGMKDLCKDLCEAKGSYCETKCRDAARGCCPEPACCEKACPKACEPACEKPACCEKACPKACEPACEKPACCEKACGGERCCKAKKCRKARCCEKNACESAGCEPTCETKCHKLYRRPVVELLENLFGDKKCCKAGCKAGCEAGCETACAAGCGECGGGAAPAKGPTTAPAKAPEQAAPLPSAPKADPSAAIHSHGIYQATRSLVRN